MLNARPRQRSQRLSGHKSEFAVEGAVIVDCEEKIAFGRVNNSELIAFELVIQRFGLVRHLDGSLARFDVDRYRPACNAVVQTVDITAGPQVMRTTDRVLRINPAAALEKDEVFNGVSPEIKILCRVTHTARVRRLCPHANRFSFGALRRAAAVRQGRCLPGAHPPVRPQASDASARAVMAHTCEQCRRPADSFQSGLFPRYWLAAKGTRGFTNCAR